MDEAECLDEGVTDALTARGQQSVTAHLAGHLVPRQEATMRASVELVAVMVKYRNIGTEIGKCHLTSASTPAGFSAAATKPAG